MKKSLSVMAIFLVAAVMAFPLVAQATLTLTLSDGTNTATVTDLDGDGVVTFNSSLGNWSVNVTTGITYPTLGMDSNPIMDLNSVNVSTELTSAETLTVTLSESGYSLSSSPTTAVLAIGGTTDGTVTVKAYVDSGLISTTPAMGNNLTGSPFQAKYVGSVSPTDPSSFSLSQIITITHGTGTKSTSFDSELKVPVPPTALLLGSGLLGLLGLSWRRKRKS